MTTAALAAKPAIRVPSGARIDVPSFIDRVDDALLDEMVSTGKWVSHGGDLEDQWIGGVFDYVLEDHGRDIVGRPYAEVVGTAQFRAALAELVRGSAIEQRARIVDGCSFDGIPSLTADSVLYRGVTAETLRPDLGVFWSMCRHQSLHRFVDDNGSGFLLECRAGDVEIDWEATIRSRLDLSNGQDEHEMQLVPGRPVQAVARRVTFLRTTSAQCYPKPVLGPPQRIDGVS